MWCIRRLETNDIGLCVAADRDIFRNSDGAIITSQTALKEMRVCYNKGR